MKKIFISSFLILVSLLSLAWACVPSTAVACMINCKDSYGSGIILSKGYVLTAAHVVSDVVAGHIVKISSPMITFDDNSKRTARIEKFDRKLDLALLQTGHRFTGVSFGTTPLRGDPIWIIGCSGGFRNSLKRGIVSNSTEMDLMTDTLVSPGDSGGPVLNDDGELVGLTQAMLLTHGTIYVYGVAVPINTIKTFVGNITIEN
jgi:serine protease Do